MFHIIIYNVCIRQENYITLMNLCIISPDAIYRCKNYCSPRLNSGILHSQNGQNACWLNVAVVTLLFHDDTKFVKTLEEEIVPISAPHPFCKIEYEKELDHESFNNMRKRLIEKLRDIRNLITNGGKLYSKLWEEVFDILNECTMSFKDMKYGLFYTAISSFILISKIVTGEDTKFDVNAHINQKDSKIKFFIPTGVDKLALAEITKEMKNAPDNNTDNEFRLKKLKETLDNKNNMVYLMDPKDFKHGNALFRSDCNDEAAYAYIVLGIIYTTGVHWLAYLRANDGGDRWFLYDGFSGINASNVHTWKDVFQKVKQKNAESIFYCDKVEL